MGCGAWDCVGPRGTVWDRVGPRGTVWDRMGPCGTVWVWWDRMGMVGWWDRVGRRTGPRSPRHARARRGSWDWEGLSTLQWYSTTRLTFSNRVDRR